MTTNRRDEAAMRRAWLGAVLSLAVTLASCGDGGGSSSSTATSSTGSTTATGCTPADRESWALATLQEWWLFPNDLATNVNPASYTDLGSYIDALTAPARAKGEDRYFTYVTSIAEENAYYSSGSTAGFGFRIAANSASRVFVAEAFEGSAALAAGIDRGAEILAVGNDASSLAPVSQIIASGDTSLTNALGPATAGTSRALQIKDTNGTRTVTLTKTNYTLTPVSSRYGAQIISDGGHKVGYVNLRTFIDTADPALRAAFLNFKNNGVTDVIVDLRYNGGGLISIAQLFGNLLGGARSSSDVFDYVTYRPEKSAYNSTDRFSVQAESIAPAHIAFIGMGGTASASELVINGMLPYLATNEALIGANTYGKPVGQTAIDRTACDDRLRVIAFALQNANHQGSYYNGLAGFVQSSCQAADDTGHPLGDPSEASTRAALDFVEGKSCATGAIPAGQTTQAVDTSRLSLLTPARPTTAQKETPGLY